MDPDLAIVLAFNFAAFLFALAGGLVVAHEVRKSRSASAAEKARERVEGTETQSGRDPTMRASRAIRGRGS
jgi:hypothetical protein